MKRLLMSLAVIGVVASTTYFGFTGAFFSDTETSEDNVLQAGALDLKVDSMAHYAGMICLPNPSTDPQVPEYVWQEETQGSSTRPELLGEECFGTWPESDLTSEKFFDLTDIKPGDEGENTISLHVYDNDAWGRFMVSGIVDADNTCTEPEDEAAGELCTVAAPEGSASGELSDYVTFTAWLDQGGIPGFQCNDPENQEPTTPDANGGCTADPTEGDNIHQGGAEPEEFPIWDGVLAENGQWELAELLAAVYQVYCTDDSEPVTPVDGHNEYGLCHGLAEDGRMVGSTTYYFGLAWELPDDTGNIVQTDSLEADMSFDVIQHRNNPGGFPTPTIAPTPTGL